MSSLLAPAIRARRHLCRECDDAPDIVREARGAFETVGAGNNLTDLRVRRGHALGSQRFDAIVAWITRQVDVAG